MYDITTGKMAPVTMIKFGTQPDSVCTHLELSGDDVVIVASGDEIPVSYKEDAEYLIKALQMALDEGWWDVDVNDPDEEF